MNPKLIVTLGNFATRSMLGTKLGITKIRGVEFGFHRAGVVATLVPTLHPAAVLRNGHRAFEQSQGDFELVSRRMQELHT